MKKGVRPIASLFSRASRKGLSPLIATVLLIAFAVALGVMVMNWGKSTKPLPNAPIKVKLEPFIVEQRSLLCFDPQAYKIRPETVEYQLCLPDDKPADQK